MANKYRKATIGGGCFWCFDAQYRLVKGIKEVVSGYAGGHLPYPTEHQVHMELTGHAEVIQLTFDPGIISYEKILEIFWHIHDPTTLNRQGNDVGPSYRSVILYHDVEQKRIAEKTKKEVAEKLWDDPVVTEIKKLGAFYPANEHHQDYYNKNPQARYCQIIINPKVAKFREKFKKWLK